MRWLELICTEPAWDGATVAVPPQFVPRTQVEAEGGNVHRHPWWLIKVVLRGRLRVRAIGGPSDHPAPAFLLVPPRWQHSATIGADVSPATIWLAVARETETLTFRLWRGAKPIFEQQLTEAAWGHALELLPGHDFEAMLQCLATALDKGPAAFAGIYGAAMLRCLFHAVRLTLMAQRPAAAGRGLANEVRRELEDRYYDADLRVRDVARLLQLSQGELSRRYKRQTGRTVRDALIRLRLERARSLLRQGGLSIKEVAHATGWRNQHYFSNAYKQRLGIRPSITRSHSSP